MLAKLMKQARLLIILIWGLVFGIGVDSHLLAQSETAYSITWNHSGTKLAVGYNTGQVQILDTASGQVQQTFQFPGVPVDVEWSPTDPHILAVTATDPGRVQFVVQVLNVATNQTIMMVEGAETIDSIAWSPDGNYLAGAKGFLASGFGIRYISIWQVSTGVEIKIIPFKEEDVTSIAWSPDGGRIAGGSTDMNITIWDVNTGNPIRTLAGHNDVVWAVAWSPDGSKIASSSGVFDRAVRIWDAATGQNIVTFTNFIVSDLSWSSNNRYIVAAGTDDWIPIWDVNAGQLLDTINSDRPIRTVAWSPDGAKIAYAREGTDSVTIIPAPTTISSPILFASSRDGNWELYTVQPDGSSPTRLTNHPATDTAPAWSPDRSQIAFTSERDGSKDIYTMNADW